MKNIKAMRSVVRYILNMARRKYVKNPLFRKKLSILYHNIIALVDFRVNTEKEIFDYTRIIKGKRFYYCRELYYGNIMYGHANILKKYCGYNHKINGCIEHGLFWGDWVFSDEAINSGLNCLITFGKTRLDVLNIVSTVPVVPIGPYIHYAKPLLSMKEINDIKSENGRTLLVFPSHSIDRVESEFDEDALNSEIVRVKNELKIDHVMVCLFYKDVEIGRDRIYLDKGYQVVCSGYRCDPIFLRRLKTFILLSDYTMSNEVGTNLGYCIYLNKPHYLFKQKIDFNPYIKKDMENIDLGDERIKQLSEVEKYFTTIYHGITDDQRIIVNKYWGTEFIKTKDELLSVFLGYE